MNKRETESQYSPLPDDPYSRGYLDGSNYQLAIHERDTYRIYADDLAEALRVILDQINDSRKGRPITRACNRMEETAIAALEKWQRDQSRAFPSILQSAEDERRIERDCDDRCQHE